MSRPIHGKSTAALKFLRKEPAALAVYWCYVARSNGEGVAWPSGDGLARDTGWDKATCLKGRNLLVELKALELVEKYIRPQWRSLTGKPLAQKLNLDRSEYYRPTATITVKGTIYNLLYVGGNDENDIDNFTHSVRRPPSMPSHMQPDKPELDSSSSELGSNKLPVAPDGTTDSDYQDFLDKLTAQPSQITRPTGLPANPNNPHVSELEARIEGGEPDDEALLVKAVETTLRLYGQAAVVYAKMLLGKRGRGEFNEYRMDVPVSATELQDWVLWYERKHAGLGKPTTPMKLTSSILEYRAEQAQAGAVSRQYQPVTPDDLPPDNSASLSAALKALRGGKHD